MTTSGKRAQLLDLEAARIWRTLRPLRPSQLAWRAFHVARRPLFAAVAPWVVRRCERARPRVRWNDPGLAAATDLRIELHGDRYAERAARFTARAWAAPSTAGSASTRLERLEHQLMHDAVALAAAGRGDDLAEHVRGWACSHPLWRSGGTDAWNSWAAATRIASWLMSGQLLERQGQLTTELDELLTGRLLLDVVTVASGLEHDLGNNHVVRDAHGLFFATRTLDALRGSRLEARTRQLLARTLAEQVLEDGGHFERVPGYHASVLEDVLELRALAPEEPGLDGVAKRMASFLAAIVHPDGEIPLLADSSLGRSAPTARLLAACPSARASDTARVSGIGVLRGPRRHLIWRCGPHGPAHITGHCHGDLLAFELSLDGRRAVVDCGVASYEPGPARDHTRSTAAHNTIEIDGESQIEAWSSFRTGRRGRARLVADGPHWQIADHDAYRHLPGRPRHRRLALLGPAETVLLLDQVTGDGAHTIASRIHLAPGRSGGAGHTSAQWKLGAAWILASAGAAIRSERTLVHRELGHGEAATVLVGEASSTLPWAGGWLFVPRGPDPVHFALETQPTGELLAEVRVAGAEFRIRWSPEDDVRVET